MENYSTNQRLKRKKRQTTTLKDETTVSKKHQLFTFNLMLHNWMTNDTVTLHPAIICILKIAALIPPSTAEVEPLFSLMNLISMPLHKRLNSDNLGHCMRICQFPHELTDADYIDIINRWLKGDVMKTGQRRVSHILDKKAVKHSLKKLFIFIFYLIIKVHFFFLYLKSWFLFEKLPSLSTNNS